MANAEDLHEAIRVVEDTMKILEWCGRSDALLITRRPTPQRRGSVRPVIGSDSIGSYTDGLQQIRAAFQEFLDAVENPGDDIFLQLDSAGWTGQLLAFKTDVLKRSGREPLLEAVRLQEEGHQIGPFPKWIFRRLVNALNAALGSLAILPGVGLIKEAKDFVERNIAADDPPPVGWTTDWVADEEVLRRITEGWSTTRLT